MLDLQTNNMKREKLETVTMDNINHNLLNVQYAVRGPILQRAEQIEKELEKGVVKPFERVVRANIGDSHALGQKPITFIRQVLSLVANPDLLESSGFPEDAKKRAQELLCACTKQSVGAYSPSPGLPLLRRRIAESITSRDGAPASPDDIYVGSGASDLIKTVLSMFVEDVHGKPPSVMLPCPQYPIFSATLAELGLGYSFYYLDEAHNWALNLGELERSYKQASASSEVRAIVIINPGNPTGQVLSQQNIEEVIKFAYNHNLFILADEVYQYNVVCKPFYSFKRVMHEMGSPYCNMELASFLSLSKGWAAESGLRSGYVELLRLQPNVKQLFANLRGLMQCPNVLGQCALDCFIKPPAPGEESYEKFMKELTTIQQVLAERCRTASDTFNSIPGYSCNDIDGALYAYPRVEIPERAQIAAKQLNMSPDEYYVLRLLEETGVCVVPGTGFGQLPGTFHFRTTILHPKEEFDYMMHSIRNFHMKFLNSVD